MIDSETAFSTQGSPIDNQQRERYDRIQAFSLDLPDVSLPFSQRLAQENKWSVAFTHQVIVEYKKFAFLAVTAEHPVTPSKAVDKAWHLHLIYTKSYWDVFCPQVLQAPLHHDPTEGGSDEQQKFEDWYRQTRDSYQHFFGQAPPQDIWPTSETLAPSRSPFFVNSQLQLGLVVSVVILATLVLGGFYIGRFQQEIDLVEVLPALLIGLIIAFGTLQFFAGVVNFIRHPTSLPGGGGWCGYG